MCLVHTGWIGVIFLIPWLCDCKNGGCGVHWCVNCELGDILGFACCLIVNQICRHPINHQVFLVILPCVEETTGALGRFGDLAMIFFVVVASFHKK